MTLDDFLKVHSDKWTLEKLAEAVSVHLAVERRPCHRSTLTRLLRSNGGKERKQQRTASPYLAIAIENATSGLVTAEDLPMSDSGRALLVALRGTAKAREGKAAAAVGGS